MKNLSNILQRANFTPLERVATLVRNNAHKEKTGKDILSESQLHALTQSWSPRLGSVNEYNKYVGVARLESTMRVDFHLFAYRAELALSRNQRILSYSLADTKRMNKTNDDEIMKGITQEESIRFATTHTYLEYRHTLHLFTLFNLPLEVRQDLVLLDRSVAFSKEYFEDEVLLYGMLKDGKLNKKDKETLIETIFTRLYYDGVRKMRGGSERDGFLVGGSFAELSMEELMRKVAQNAGIDHKEKNEDELLDALAIYTTEKGVTIASLVREALSTWLDDGLFTRDFTPIFFSDRHNTWDGDTKKSHSELFTLWYEELEKSKKYFSGLFSARKLKKQEMEMNILGEKKVHEIITGDSLYACREDLEFVEEYKKQMDMILPFSNFALFIEKYAKPIRNYTTLCQFKKLGIEMADIFDADFTEQYNNLIESFEDEVKLLNYDLSKLTDVATEHLYQNAEEEFRYSIHIMEGKFWIDLEEEAEADDIVEKYAEEFRKAMQ